jgi:hypothetical protein
MKQKSLMHFFQSHGELFIHHFWGLIHLCILLAWRLILWLVDSFQFFTIMKLGFFLNSKFYLQEFPHLVIL